MYADKLTRSMESAIDETARRRNAQMAFNVEHEIEPQTIRKAVNDIMRFIDEATIDSGGETSIDSVTDELSSLAREEVLRIISSLEDDMAAAAASMDFEQAARFRDQAVKLRARIEGTTESAVLDRLRSTARKGSAMGARKPRARSRKK